MSRMYRSKRSHLQQLKSNFLINAQGYACEACLDPDASTCTKFRATACSALNLYEGTCVAKCPRWTFTNNRACTHCVDPDAYTCTSTAATSCKTLSLSNGACVGSCPNGTFGSKGICAACPDSGALTCDGNGFSLTCSGPGYQVDYDTNLCAPVVFSLIENYWFSYDFTAGSVFLVGVSETDCMSSWLTSGQKGGFFKSQSGVCVYTSGFDFDGSLFRYEAATYVLSYLTGSCEWNAGRWTLNDASL